MSCCFSSKLGNILVTEEKQFLQLFKTLNMFVLGQGSFVVAGKVESGSVQNGDRVMLMPAGESGMIKGLKSPCIYN